MKKVKNSMIKVAGKISAGLGVVTVFLGFPRSAHATVLPGFVQKIVDSAKGSNTTNYVNTRVRIGLTAVFVGVFLTAVGYSALAGAKFMSSQGDSGKLEESKAAVKAILMGFAAMIGAIVGIFVIIYILGAGGEEPGSEFCLDPNNPLCTTP